MLQLEEEFHNFKVILHLKENYDFDVVLRLTLGVTLGAQKTKAGMLHSFIFVFLSRSTMSVMVKEK